MKQYRLIIFFLLLSLKVVGQKAADDFAAIDIRALQIPDALTTTTKSISDYINMNFMTSAEKVRAIFIWTASNLQYDIDNMYALNFYEKRDEKIDKALKTRKGICSNYAAVFNDICVKCGIKSYIIAGYTKQNGIADYISHEWCAAFIDTAWFLFDPTWGSGYIQNNAFVRKINNGYFKVLPANLIKSHMPFDPLWEFLYYPVTNQEFYEGKIQVNKSNPYFSFPDSIEVFDRQGEPERLSASAGRIEKNGIKNSLIFDRLAHIRSAIEAYNQNKMISQHNEAVTSYNLAIADYNEGVNFLNVFIRYRNNQFKPKKTDPEIQSMIDSADYRLAAANTKLSGIKFPDSTTSAIMSSFRKSLDEAKSHVDEQKEFLARYFSKGTLGRKACFTKYTWMGLPLN